MWHSSHHAGILLHCLLWPSISLLLGALLVLLTVCARSLAARAEALQKRRGSYEDLQATPPDRRGNEPGDPLTTTSDPEPLFTVPVRRRDRDH